MPDIKDKGTTAEIAQFCNSVTEQVIRRLKAELAKDLPPGAIPSIRQTTLDLAWDIWHRDPTQVADTIFARIKATMQTRERKVN